MIWAHGIALHHETEKKNIRKHYDGNRMKSISFVLLKSGKFKVAYQHSRPAP